VIIEQVMMTPHDAEKLLMASHGVRQRTIRSDRVLRLIRAIQAGQWRLTHQPVAIDRDGAIIDGQHRLTAIAGSGIDVPIMLARDVDPATFSVLDTGASRSPSDILKIAGHTTVNVLAAACRYLLAYDAVVGTSDSLTSAGRAFTAMEILELADDPERGRLLISAIAAAQSISVALNHNGYITFIAPVIVLMKESPVDDGLALEFTERLRDGAGLPAGSPILALRRFMIQDTGLSSTKHNERAAVGMATMIKAYNSWLQGDTRVLMSFKPGIERMPMILPALPGGPAYLPG
jgi:hypothetical protein